MNRIRIDPKIPLKSGNAPAPDPKTAKSGGKFQAALNEKAAAEPIAEPTAEAASEELDAEIPIEARAGDPAPKGPAGKDDVPDSWKHPVGPYRQAPPEHGGQWWYVSPFTGEAPWTRFSAEAVAELKAKQAEANKMPDGFLEVFGPKPHDRIERVKWEQDLKYFKRPGPPPDVPPEKLEAIRQTTVEWGMGEPRWYEGRYGWYARFPQSAFPDHDVGLTGLTMGLHQAIARYQVKLIRRGGVEPPTRHPFVPPHVRVPDKDDD